MPQLLPSSLSVLLVTVLRKSKTIDYSPKSHFVPPIYRQYITAVSTNIADISFQLKYRSKYHRYMAIIAIVGEFCLHYFYTLRYDGSPTESVNLLLMEVENDLI